MKIENVAQFSSEQEYDEISACGTIMTPTEFISNAIKEEYTDSKGYADLAYCKAFIKNIIISIDDFLISVLCERERKNEILEYEIDEFFEVFGYENFEIIWHIKDI